MLRSVTVHGEVCKAVRPLGWRVAEADSEQFFSREWPSETIVISRAGVGTYRISALLDAPIPAHVLKALRGIRNRRIVPREDGAFTIGLSGAYLA